MTATSATVRATFRIDRALWDAYWASAAGTGLDPAMTLEVILNAWANGTNFPDRPAPERLQLAWGRNSSATLTLNSAWWQGLKALCANAGYTRADVIDRACRWWLGIDTLPPAPPSPSGLHT
jgi:hypothetical protein